MQLLNDTLNYILLPYRLLRYCHVILHWCQSLYINYILYDCHRLCSNL